MPRHASGAKGLPFRRPTVERPRVEVCHAEQDPVDRRSDPDAVVQRHPRPAVATPAAAAPRHDAAGRSRRSRAAVPDGADHAGGHAGQLRRHPRRSARRLPTVEAVAAVPCPSAGEGARYPGADLLQVRGRQPGRVAQAQHRRAAGVLQPPGGHHQADDRDRRRAVGHRVGVRHRAVRHRMRDLAGRCVVRGEAVPPGDDGDLRRDGALQPVGRHRLRPHRCWPRIPITPAVSASRSPRPSAPPWPTRRRATRSAAC